MDSLTLARIEIQHLVAEFAWNLDRGQGEAAAALFSEQAVFVTLAPPFDGTTSETIRGREALARRWDGNRGRNVRHLFLNHRIAPDCTGETASGTSTVIAFRGEGAANSPADIYLVSDWHDRYVRENGSWRFLRRQIVPLFWSRDHFPQLFASSSEAQ